MNNFRYPSGRIVQFAKAPQLGRVKTRMQPHLTQQQSLALHKKLVSHTYHSLLHCQLCPVALWVAGQNDGQFFQEILEPGSQVIAQQGENLGERMAYAAQSTLQTAEFVIIVGSDCPFFDEAYLCEAIKVLHDGNQVVVGPATDGGYVMIGFWRQCDPRVFEGIRWGGEDVFRHTCERLEQVGLSYTCLPAKHDIDRPEDLQLLDASFAL